MVIELAVIRGMRSSRSTRRLADLNKSVRLDPEDAVSYGVRGVVWANLGQNERAITEFSQSLKLDPQNFNVVKNRAKCWERTANPAKAVDDYALAMRIDPNDADVCRRLGQILTSDGLNEIDPKKIVLLAMDLSDSKAWKPNSDDASLLREMYDLGALGRSKIVRQKGGDPACDEALRVDRLGELW